MSLERKVFVVTDSTAKLSKDLIRQHEVGVAPLSFTIDDGVSKKTYEDGSTSEDFFTAKLSDKKNNVTTAAPSVGKFRSIYESYTGDILSIHIGRNLSRTHESAKSAVDMLKRENNIKIYDSGTTTKLLGIQVIRAAQLAREGKSVEDICRELDDLKRRSTIIATFKDLYYLKKSGRINDLTQIIGSILKIYPILDVRNSKVKDVKKERGIERALNLTKDLALSLEPTEIYVMHGGDDEYSKKASEITDEFKKKLGKKVPVETSYIGTVITTHTGPETLGIGIVSKQPLPEKLIFSAK
jgi:DegV family protein with EDD domain